MNAVCGESLPACRVRRLLCALLEEVVCGFSSRLACRKRETAMASSGRGMALYVLLAMAVLLLFQAYESAAVVYNVGDRATWTLPSIDYTAWALKKPLRVNDVLRFTYAAEVHDVVVVNKVDYDNCESQRPIAVYANGNTMIKLTKPGMYYFICDVPGHCEAGMKMQVNVS